MDYSNPTVLQKWLLEEAVAMLHSLTADATPRWGQMRGHHVVEHLSDTLAISNGVIAVPLQTPADKVARYNAWILSPDTMLKPGVRVAGLVPETPKPPRKATIEESRAMHERNVQRFVDFFAANPAEKPIHPIFGPLDYHGWLIFHYKHYTHHLSQFGCIPIPDNPAYDSVRNEEA